MIATVQVRASQRRSSVRLLVVYVLLRGIGRISRHSSPRLSSWVRGRGRPALILRSCVSNLISSFGSEHLSNHLFYFSHKQDGSTAVMKVFRNGFLDVIDDVFWMLPFFSVVQAQLVARITTSRWTTGPSAACGLCRSTVGMEPGSSWQQAGNHGSLASASRRPRRRLRRAQPLKRRFLSTMIDPKTERLCAWRGQELKTGPGQLPAMRFSKTITDTI